MTDAGVTTTHRPPTFSICGCDAATISRMIVPMMIAAMMRVSFTNEKGLAIARESLWSIAMRVSVAGPALLSQLTQHLLACSDRFSLALGARLLVLLTLFQFREDSRLR